MEWTVTASIITMHCVDIDKGQVCDSRLYALNKSPVFIHCSGSVNGKHTKMLGLSRKIFQPINTLLQEYGREGSNLIGERSLMFQLNRIADLNFTPSFSPSIVWTQLSMYSLYSLDNSVSSRVKKKQTV